MTRTADQLGTYTDDNGNHHFYDVAPTDWQKNKFILHIDHAGDFLHIRTTCLVSVYKTKPLEIFILGWCGVSDRLLAAIVKDAIARF